MSFMSTKKHIQGQGGMINGEMNTEQELRYFVLDFIDPIKDFLDDAADYNQWYWEK